jgi:hypothetical protein
MCGAPIMFCITENNKKMPLDAQEVTFFQVKGVHCYPVKGHKTHFETCKPYREKKINEARGGKKGSAGGTGKAVQSSIIS